MIDVIHSANVPAMTKMLRQRQRFALVYADPPFFTNRKHVTTSGELAFDDRWADANQYLAGLLNSFELARELLTPDGSLVVHLDTRVVHRVKLLLDELFGPECFASEIIWRYRRWPSPTRNFQRVHDTLLRYVRDSRIKPRFRQLYEPLSPKTLEQWGQRKQRAVTGQGAAGKARRVRSSTTSRKSPGAPLGDVWEIGVIGPASDERVGYPTQKPEALLERIVQSLTEPRDFVLDPFMGSGTTLAVAARLGRSAVGIDSSAVAIRTARARLRRFE